MKSLLLDYGFNIMEYRVLDNQKDRFTVLSLITGKTYEVLKESKPYENALS